MLIDQEATEWNILRTRSRQENVVEEFLVKKRIKAYLPKISQIRQWKDRRKTVEFPLFPGYVFVKPKPDEFPALSYVPGSCGVLMERNRPGVVHEGEIDAIRILLGVDMHMSLHEGLMPGARIRVIVGPLAGVEGELLRLKNQNRLVINARLLGQAVSVEVNVNEITRL